MSMPDWKELQPKFAAIRRDVGLLALKRIIGCSRASVDRWAKGKAQPSTRPHQERIREIVKRASQVRRPDGLK